jgi:hypothetical protein
VSSLAKPGPSSKTEAFEQGRTENGARRETQSGEDEKQRDGAVRPEGRLNGETQRALKPSWAP